MNSYNTTAYINLTALQNNVRIIKKLAPNSSILAMVKRNAYNHGAVKIAPAIQPLVHAFGVACMDEALALHNAGITKPILLLKGFYTEAELRTIDQLKFATVIHNTEQLNILESTYLQNKLDIWLKINTGMNRLGFKGDLIVEAYNRLMQNPQVNKPLHLMTHFADADMPNSQKTHEQFQKLQTIIANFSGTVSAANSAATLLYPETQADWIRPGITMYGVSPFANKSITPLGFQPIMTLASRLIAIQELEPGETVGYDSTWIAKKSTRVGIVNTGYGDGYPRHIQPETPILVNGKRCPIVGRVAMDMLNVDLGTQPHAKVGDPVILWGADLPVEEIAAKANTIAYELLCQITQRVTFEYHE